MSVGLDIKDLTAGWGPTVVLDRISLTVAPGAKLAVLGRNGAGKTTLLASIMGLATRLRGTIKLGDQVIDLLPTHRRARLGLGYVPQEREIFPSLTVEENLAVATLPGGWPAERAFALFPALAERRQITGNRLSGGEQQMLAIARALVGGPKLLLLDEPLEGLAPIVVEALFAALATIRDDTGVTMILAEQKAELALSFAEDVVVLERGRAIYRGDSADFRADEQLQHRVLAVGR
ncbi:MAG TPA: ABC transporter ATP-binding protein [Candidatus Dormibacteraeota bacterium]|nr:ABC transporter ATP-binding protein [Candidatus Dormibacteraeota bacterium]